MKQMLSQEDNKSGQENCRACRTHKICTDDHDCHSRVHSGGTHKEQTLNYSPYYMNRSVPGRQTSEEHNKLQNQPRQQTSKSELQMQRTDAINSVAFRIPPDPELKDPPKIISCNVRWQSACCKRVTSSPSCIGDDLVSVLS